MTTSVRRAIQMAFYGGLAVLLLLITTGILGNLLPRFSSRIAYNSEAHFFALFLGAWIQFALPRLNRQQRMRWALGAGAVFAIIGIGLILSDFPSRIRTLNESALALAVLIPYLSLPRPVNRWLLLSVPILITLTAWAAVWAPSSWLIDQAETVGFIVLAVLTFDVFDRALLEENALVSRAPRIAWYSFMVFEPIVVSALGTDLRQGGGGLALTLEFLGRIHESFIGVLLVAFIIHVGTMSSARVAGLTSE